MPYLYFKVSPLSRFLQPLQPWKHRAETFFLIIDDCVGLSHYFFSLQGRWNSARCGGDIFASNISPFYTSGRLGDLEVSRTECCWVWLVTFHRNAAHPCPCNMSEYYFWGHFVLPGFFKFQRPFSLIVKFLFIIFRLPSVQRWCSQRPPQEGCGDDSNVPQPLRRLHQLLRRANTEANGDAHPRAPSGRPARWHWLAGLREHKQGRPYLRLRQHRDHWSGVAEEQPYLQGSLALRRRRGEPIYGTPPYVLGPTTPNHHNARRGDKAWIAGTTNSGRPTIPGPEGSPLDSPATEPGRDGMVSGQHPRTRFNPPPSARAAQSRDMNSVRTFYADG